MRKKWILCIIIICVYFLFFGFSNVLVVYKIEKVLYKMVLDILFIFFFEFKYISCEINICFFNFLVFLYKKFKNKLFIEIY